MKKIIFGLALSSTLLASAFAATTNYKLIESNSEFCSPEMQIVDSGNSMSLNMHSDLGSYFNLDSSEGVVIINSINGKSLVYKAVSSSHGIKTKTTTTATRDERSLNLVTEVKFGTFGAERALNELVVDFDGDKVEVNIKRSYRELMGSGWENESNCVYQLQ